MRDGTRGDGAALTYAVCERARAKDPSPSLLRADALALVIPRWQGYRIWTYSRSCPLLPLREKVPEGRMRGCLIILGASGENPSSVAARHLLPQGEKGSPYT